MSYLTEAFKALDALNEDTFSVSDDGIKKLAEFEDNDDLVDEITVYDADAEDTEDLEDSYVGKVIVDCNVCHSKIYKDKSDVVIDEETQNANITEECPYCYSTDGFKVIGEVAPMTTETEEKVKVEDDIEESCKSQMNESKNPPEHSIDIGTRFTLVEPWEYDSYDNFELVFDYEDDYEAEARKFIKKYPELLKGDWIVFPKGSKFELIWMSGNASTLKSLDYNIEIPNNLDYFEDDIKKGLFDFDDSTLSLEEATVTDYKGSLSNVLVKNQDKISNMTSKGEILDFLDSITDEVRDKNYLETVKRNMQKKNDFGALQYIYGIILSGEGKGVTESLEENIGQDIDEYQQWVDYDMKRYHKISDKTNDEIRKAGLQVVKDKYGDYQVIAGKYDESLKEDLDRDLDIISDIIDNYKDITGYDILDAYKGDRKDKEIVATMKSKIRDYVKNKYNESLKESVDNETKEMLRQAARDIGQSYLVTDDIQFETDSGKTQVYIHIANDDFVPYDDILSRAEKILGNIVDNIHWEGDYLVGDITDYLKDEENESLKEDTQLKLFDDDMIKDIDVIYQWRPEEVERILDKHGSDKNSDNWITGLDLPAAYAEIMSTFKSKYADYDEIDSKVAEVLGLDESLKESVKDITITTDDSKTTMTSNDEGKVTLTTEPVEEHKDKGEVIEPLTDETEAEIEANDGEEDVDIEDFDEESFDELGEGYFKNVYENVDSFKTSNITTKDNKVIVEGVITFDNNVKKNTSFLFESANKTKSGKYRFIGENLNVTKGNKAFSLIGNVTDKKFLSESMNYNYRTKNDIGKSIRCCGTIKRG